MYGREENETTGNGREIKLLMIIPFSKLERQSSRMHPLLMMHAEPFFHFRSNNTHALRTRYPCTRTPNLRIVSHWETRPCSRHAQSCTSIHFDAPSFKLTNICRNAVHSARKENRPPLFLLCPVPFWKRRIVHPEQNLFQETLHELLHLTSHSHLLLPVPLLNLGKDTRCLHDVLP